MPGFVTSMDVAPPDRTENLGIEVSRIALILFRLAKSGSHFVFFCQGNLLTQCGKCYLASPVFNCLSPDLFDLEARRLAV